MEFKKVKDRTNKVWNDPVGSKVIATIILGISAYVLVTLKSYIYWLSYETPIWIFILSMVISLSTIYYLFNKKYKTYLSKFEESIRKDISKIILSEINLHVGSHKFEIERIKQNLLKLESLCLKNQCPSLNRHNSNLETLTLTQLLEKSIEYYNFSKEEYLLNDTLDGIIEQLEHFRKDFGTYESERIYKAINQLGEHFHVRTEKIKKLLIK